MTRRWALAAYLVALCSGSSSAGGWNPYAAPADEFERRLQSAAFGEPGGDRALEDWLTANPQSANDQRLQGYNQLCIDFGVLTWNRLRATACAEYARIKKVVGTGESGDDDQGSAAAFADQPSIRARGSARVPLSWNLFGSQSADVIVNGIKSSWFVDTGAEITVLTQSLAQRMGVRSVGRGIRVGTTTSDVTGRVGIIDRLRIGSANVENVPVLILPDAQLKVGNVHQIDGILGLQVLAAFGRIAWINGGSQLALGDAAPRARPTSPHIYWDDEGLGVPVRTARGIRGAFLDTGANVTDWRSTGLALLDPASIAAAKEKIMHVGGAGGVVELKQRELKSISFELGLVPLRLERVSIASSDSNSAAKIGMDAVSQFGTFILDFEQMRIDGRLKTAAERKATHKTSLAQKDFGVESNRDKKSKAPK